jgi:tetratricopeptide (TPR) repeat protein
VNEGEFESPFQTRLTSFKWFTLFLGLSLLCYWRALNGDFIWDDLTYVAHNPLVTQAHGLSGIWSSTAQVEYWPLTYSAFWLEWRLWGESLLGYHLVNLVLHAANSFLIYKILMRLRFRWALLVAILFCVHPVNTEAVAWIFQQKTLLSSFLALVSSLFFLNCVAKRSPAHYMAALVLFASSLLTKPVAIMLPLVFFGIFRRAPWAIRTEGNKNRSPILKFSPLIPFFALSLADGLLNLWWYHVAHVFPPADGIPSHSWIERTVLAGCNLWFYFFKDLVPHALSFIYSSWQFEVTQLSAASVLGWLALPAWIALLFVIYRSSKTRSIGAGLLYFTVLVFPALGFSDIYFMRYAPVADHWQYLALPGALVVLVATYEMILSRVPASVRQNLAIAVIAVFAIFTFSRASIYQNEMLVWQDTLEKNPFAWMAHSNLGILLGNQNQDVEAEKHFQMAIQLNPLYPEAYFNLAVIENHDREYAKAIENLRTDLNLNPPFPSPIHDQLGVAQHGLGKLGDAENEFRLALRQNNSADIHFRLAFTLQQDGKLQEAASEFESGLALNPSQALRDRAEADLKALLARLPSSPTK